MYKRGERVGGTVSGNMWRVGKGRGMVERIDQQKIYLIKDFSFLLNFSTKENTPTHANKMKDLTVSLLNTAI